MSPKTIGKIVRFFSWLEGIMRRSPDATKVVIVLLGFFWATNFVPMAVKYGNENPGVKPIMTERVATSHGLLDRAKNSPGEEFAWEKEGWENYSSRMLRWLLVFYLRMMLAVTLYYLYQMSKRRGILATILADKKHFALAIVSWPVMIFRYPHNVVREIVAEAELRRLRNPFRRLSKSEQETVRAVASDGRQFKNWRADFHLRNRNKFQRSFTTALLVTIVLILFAPIARSAPVETHCHVSACINSPPCPVQMVQSDQPDQQDPSNAGTAILADEFLLVIPLALSFVIETVREKLITGPVRDLIPIPKISPVFTT